MQSIHPPPRPSTVEQDERGFVATAMEYPAEAIAAASKHHLRNGSFDDQRYAAVWRAVKEIHAEGQPVNFMTIGARLALNPECKHLDREFLVPLSGEHIGPAMADYHATGIAAASKRRTEIEALRNVLQSVERGDDTAGVIRDALETLDAAQANQSADGLPPIVTASALVTDRPETPDEVIRGVLHQGGKLMLGGTSKSNKTWVLLDLAISIAHDRGWVGLKTTPGKVLFVNLEVQEWAFAGRIEAVAKAKGVSISDDRLHVWNLRGHAAPFDVLLPRIIERTKAEGYALVILDPIYKLYGGTDENSAGDVANLLNGIERLTTETKAAVAFSAHFAKGNAASKESIDRVSGSGVFARDPDAILTLTPHETESAFTIEPTLRNFAPVEPFAVRWEFPLMRLADDLDPAKLKQVGGRKKAYNVEMLTKALIHPMTTTEWMQASMDESGMGERKFYELKAEAVKADMVYPIGNKWTIAGGKGE